MHIGDSVMFGVSVERFRFELIDSQNLPIVTLGVIGTEQVFEATVEDLGIENVSAATESCDFSHGTYSIQGVVVSKRLRNDSKELALIMVQRKFEQVFATVSDTPRIEQIAEMLEVVSAPQLA